KDGIRDFHVTGVQTCALPICNFSNILMVRNLRLGLFMSEKKKSVLVGTYYLNYVGGSQLYTYDLITELKARDDIDVEFFAIELGDLSAYMQDKLGVSFMGDRKSTRL